MTDLLEGAVRPRPETTHQLPILTTIRPRPGGHASLEQVFKDRDGGPKRVRITNIPDGQATVKPQ